MASYQIDSKWRIVRANDACCRALRCTEAGLIGLDVRDLLRADWRLDFRAYVSRALVGIGDADVTLPLVAPCGEQGWFKHTIEPLMHDGNIAGYRATIVPRIVPAPAKRWWSWRAAAPRTVWNFDDDQLAKAS